MLLPEENQRFFWTISSEGDLTLMQKFKRDVLIAIYNQTIIFVQFLWQECCPFIYGVLFQFSGWECFQLFKIDIVLPCLV